MTAPRYNERAYATADQLFEDLRRKLIDPMFPDSMIYRGVGDASFQLLAKVEREVNDKPGMETIFSEVNALVRFIQACDKQGLPLPPCHDELRSDRQRARGYAEGRAPSDGWPIWEHQTLWAVAQHHGFPTRLLDWTKNPIAAMYFAAHGSLLQERNAPTLAVWALDTETSLYWDRKVRVIANLPGAVSVNLAAQDGVFTATLREVFSAKHQRHIPLSREPLENIISVPDGERLPLLKLILPRQEAPCANVT